MTVQSNEDFKGLDMYNPVDSTKAQCMSSEGYNFLCRYYAPLGAAKLLTKSESQTISNAGMDVVPVYEWGGTEASHFNYDNGVSNGREAISRALEIGQPFDTAIYFAVDYPATSADIPNIKDYFRGVSAAMQESKNYNGGRWTSGVYGSYLVVSELDGYSGVNYTWQTYAWSGGDDYIYRDIYQYSNGQRVCSHDIDLNASKGGWGGFRI